MAQPEGRWCLPSSVFASSFLRLFPGTLFGQVTCFLGPRTGVCCRGAEGLERREDSCLGKAFGVCPELPSWESNA